MPESPVNSQLRAVDVIILSWNRVDDTIAAIRSAIEQEDVDVNVHIVDQGSESANLSRLRNFVAPLRNVSLKVLDRNIGVAAGRNVATAMGSAPCVVALDSDAVFARPDVLAGVVNRLALQPAVGAVAFRITNYFTRKNDGTSWDYPSSCRPDRPFVCSRFIGAGHALRRSLFERVGGYDEKLFFCGEELDLCYRILDQGYRIEYLPSAEILHKVSPERRVYWGRGRYFFTVRNNLYTSYKFGIPLRRLTMAAGAFILRGMANGVAMQAIRGIREAIRMSLGFDRRSPANSYYCLKPDTWQRISRLEPWRDEPVALKVRRQLQRLPNHS